MPHAEQRAAVVPRLAAPSVVQHLVQHQHRLRQAGVEWQGMQQLRGWLNGCGSAWWNTSNV